MLGGSSFHSGSLNPSPAPTSDEGDDSSTSTDLSYTISTIDTTEEGIPVAVVKNNNGGVAVVPLHHHHQQQRGGTADLPPPSASYVTPPRRTKVSSGTPATVAMTPDSCATPVDDGEGGAVSPTSAMTPLASSTTMMPSSNSATSTTQLPKMPGMPATVKSSKNSSSSSTSRRKTTGNSGSPKSRLERFKLKAMKAASKELGISDQRQLAEAAGVDSQKAAKLLEKLSSFKKKKKKTNSSNSDNKAMDADFLSSALGLPASSFFSSSDPTASSRDEVWNRNDTSSKSRQDQEEEEEEDPNVTSSAATPVASSSSSGSSSQLIRPQAGSLGDALGMKMDTSTKAEPVRQDAATALSAATSTHRDAGIINSESCNGGNDRPKVGSLANALGMSIDTSQDSPPIRVRNQAPPPPQPNVGTTFLSEPAEDEVKSVPPSRKKGSLAELVVARINSAASNGDGDDSSASCNSSSSSVESDDFPNEQARENPREGSLAQALGLSVDASMNAPPIRVRNQDPPPPQANDGTTFKAYAVQSVSVNSDVVGRKQSLAELVLARVSISDDDEDDSSSSDEESEMSQDHQAQPKQGSLAQALGISIDTSSKAPPIRVKNHVPPPPQANVGTSFKAFASTKTTSSQAYSGTSGKKSLAALVLERVNLSQDDDSSNSSNSNGDSDDDGTETQEYRLQQPPQLQQQPRQGSLAQALGLAIDPSVVAPPIRVENQIPPPPQPYKGTTFKAYKKTILGGTSASAAGSRRKKTLADVVLAKVSFSHDEDSGSWNDSYSDSSVVNSGANQQSSVRVYEPRDDQVAPKKTLAELVLSRVATTFDDISQDRQSSTYSDETEDAIDDSAMASNAVSSQIYPVDSQTRKSLSQIVLARVSVDDTASSTSDDDDNSDEAIFRSIQPSGGGSLAAALGIQVAGVTSSAPSSDGSNAREYFSFGTSQHPKEPSQQGKNLAQMVLSRVAIDDSAESTTHYESESDESEDYFRSVQPSNGGSLAAALGTRVNVPDEARVAIRNHAGAVSSQRSLAQTVLSRVSIDDSADSTSVGSGEWEDDFVGSQPANSGSLAEALGMKVVAPSKVRISPMHVDKAKLDSPGMVASLRKYTGPAGKQASLAQLVLSRVLMDDTGSSGSESESEASEDPHVSIQKARGGSLAAALGIKVDASQDAAPIREKAFHEHHAHQDQLFSPQTGSLAAALGFKIDPSSSSAPIREPGKLSPPEQPNKGTSFNRRSQAGSSMLYTPLEMDSSVEGCDYESEAGRSHAQKKLLAAQVPQPTDSQHLLSARPGSLASALSMKVDPSGTSAPVRQLNSAAPPIQENNGTTFLGMQKQTFMSPEDQKCFADLVLSRVSNEFPDDYSSEGSSDDDSGMEENVVILPILPGRRQSGSQNFAAMVLSRVTENMADDDSYEDSSDDERSDVEDVVGATTGSLAAALGMQVDVSGGAPPIRARGLSPPPAQKHQGTTFVGMCEPACDSSASSGSDSVLDFEEEGNIATISRVAEKGSLAAALSMQIDDADSAPPIRVRGCAPPPTQRHQGTTFVQESDDASESDSDSSESGSEVDSVDQVDEVNNPESRSNEVKHSSLGTNSSLEAALGVPVDMDTAVAAIKQARAMSKSKKSLFDAAVVRMGLGDISDFEAPTNNGQQSEVSVVEKDDSDIPKISESAQRFDTKNSMLAAVMNVSSANEREIKGIVVPESALRDSSATEYEKPRIAAVYYDDQPATSPLPTEPVTKPDAVSSQRPEEDMVMVSRENEEFEEAVPTQTNLKDQALPSMTIQNDSSFPASSKNGKGILKPKSSMAKSKSGKPQYKSRLERIKAKALRAANKGLSFDPTAESVHRDYNRSDATTSTVAETSTKPSRLDRMKAKAIEAASQDLGIDADKYADAMGIATASGRPSNKNTGQQYDRVEESDIADALGISPSLFGGKPAKKGQARVSDDEPQPVALPEPTVEQRFPEEKVRSHTSQGTPENTIELSLEPKAQNPTESSAARQDDTDVGTEEYTDNPKGGKPQYKSRKERVLAKVARRAAADDPPPVTATVPVPSAQEEDFESIEATKNQSKMSRLDRMKAKAIKAANKDLGIDTGAFAETLGLSKQSPPEDKASESDTKNPLIDANEADIADALGISPSLFGAASKKKVAMEAELVSPPATDVGSSSDVDGIGLDVNDVAAALGVPVSLIDGGDQIQRAQGKNKAVVEIDEPEEEESPGFYYAGGGEGPSLGSALAPVATEDEKVDLLECMLPLDAVMQMRRASSNNLAGMVTSAEKKAPVVTPEKVIPESKEKAASSPRSQKKLEESDSSLGTPSRQSRLPTNAGEVTTAKDNKSEGGGLNDDTKVKGVGQADVETARISAPQVDIATSASTSTGPKAAQVSPININMAKVKTGMKYLESQILDAKGYTSTVAQDVQSLNSRLRSLEEKSTSSTTKDNEIESLKATLAETQTRTAEVGAYTKRLEEQLLEKSKEFSGKLEVLETKISKYEDEIEGKSNQIQMLENRIKSENDERLSVSKQWAETGIKLEKACDEVHQSRALLQQEYAEVKSAKLSIQSQQAMISKRIEDLHNLAQQRNSVSKRLENLHLQDSVDAVVNSEGNGAIQKTSDVLRSIEYNLRKEGERRKNLTARLKSRAAAATSKQSDVQQTPKPESASRDNSESESLENNVSKIASSPSEGAALQAAVISSASIAEASQQAAQKIEETKDQAVVGIDNTATGVVAVDKSIGMPNAERNAPIEPQIDKGTDEDHDAKEMFEGEDLETKQQHDAVDERRIAEKGEHEFREDLERKQKELALEEQERREQQEAQLHRKRQEELQKQKELEENERAEKEEKDRIVNEEEAAQEARLKAAEERRRKDLEEQKIREEEARIEAERVAAEKVKEEEARIEAERVAAEKAKEEEARIEAERVAEEKAKEEETRIEAERIAAEKAKEEEARIEAERIAAEKAKEEKARIEAERIAAEKAKEQARLRAEEEAKLKEQIEAEAAELERIAIQKKEEARVKAEEKERIALEEAERIAAQKAEEARLKAEEEERIAVEEVERIAQEETDAERVALEEDCAAKTEEESDDLQDDNCAMKKASNVVEPMVNDQNVDVEAQLKPVNEAARESFKDVNMESVSRGAVAVNQKPSSIPPAWALMLVVSWGLFIGSFYISSVVEGPAQEAVQKGGHQQEEALPDLISAPSETRHKVIRGALKRSNVMRKKPTISSELYKCLDTANDSSIESSELLQEGRAERLNASLLPTFPDVPSYSPLSSPYVGLDDTIEDTRPPGAAPSSYDTPHKLDNLSDTRVTVLEALAGRSKGIRRRSLAGKEKLRKWVGSAKNILKEEFETGNFWI